MCTYLYIFIYVSDVSDEENLSRIVPYISLYSLRTRQTNRFGFNFMGNLDSDQQTYKKIIIIKQQQQQQRSVILGKRFFFFLLPLSSRYIGFFFYRTI